MTMPESEQRPVSESFSPPILYSVLHNLTYPEHLHHSYEMIFVLDGTVDVYLSDRRFHLTPDSFLFLRDNVLHSYTSDDDSLALVVTAIPSGVPHFTQLLQGAETPPCLLLESDYKLRSVVDTLLDDPNALRSHISLVGYIDLMLSSVAAALRGQMVPDSAPLSTLEQALLYIVNSLPACPSLDQVADAVGISRFHLSRLFSNKLGISFNTYSSLIRLNAARRLLIQTKLSVGEIAAMCGYSNTRSFNRDFLRFVETSPRAYRTLHQNTGIVDYSTPFLRDLLQKRYSGLSS